MGLNINGFVLRPPRLATSNAKSTEEAKTGVDFDHKPLPSSYNIPGPELVDVSADQYRASTLLRPDEGQTEYILFAANTSNLSTLSDFTVTNEGSISIPNEGLTVSDVNTTNRTDGSLRLVVTDDAGRSISSLDGLTVVRGDTTLPVVVFPGGGTFSTISGVFTLTNQTIISLLGGGFSASRGDRLQSISYNLNAPRFWWSRNDQYETRFQWNGRLQRWQPLPGTAPRNLGTLLQNSEFTLSPVPQNLSIGDYLPGNSSNPDSYSMIRIGTRPDSNSTPIAQPVGGSGFGGILIVDDEELVDGFDFTSVPDAAGVVGFTTGEIQWNPDFLPLFEGQDVWYSYSTFVISDESESVGPLESDDPLFIAPIPGPTDYPFIRIGSRQYLEALIVESDIELNFLTVAEGQVGVSLSTGQIKLSQTDLNKADPEAQGFDIQYLGAEVFYDGVSLTQEPLLLREATPLVDKNGIETVVDKNQDLFIPDAQPLPSPGTSGVMYVPDDTGTIPNTSESPGIRPGDSGLVREVRGPWDLVIFGESGSIRTIRVVDDDDEIPRFAFKIPRGVAYIDLREGAGGSPVTLSREDIKRFSGEQLYFLQSGVQPAIFSKEAKVYSRIRNTFTLEGDEIIVFRIQTFTYTWDASTDPGGISTSQGGTFSAEEIATSLNAVITSTGQAVAENGRLALQTTLTVNDLQYGEIEIAFGPSGTRDLKGPAALGFLPGWKVRIANPNNQPILKPPDLQWLPDNGTFLGIARSPLNLTGENPDVSDISHQQRFEDEIVVDSISASPVVLLNNPPLEDIAGYDDGVFFQIQDGLRRINLDNYEEVFHDFGIRRLVWVDQHRQFSLVEQPSSSLFLGKTSVLPQSLRLSGNGLQIAKPGQAFQLQVFGEDYLVPQEGLPGIATLIETISGRQSAGNRGTFTSGSNVFTDSLADFSLVQEGYQLKILSGEAQGTYLVTSVVNPTTVEVSPAFLFDGTNVAWEMYEGLPTSVVDEGILADAQYVEFNHLPEETFKIRVLSDLGELPTTAQEQEANRLQAVVGDALRSGRSINVRFGLSNASPTAILTELQSEELGTIGSGLSVPNPTSSRFVNNNFSVQVGDKKYTFANGDLVKVVSFTNPLVGDIIEVQISTGDLNFGTETLSLYEGSTVQYVEEFLDPSFLNSGSAEFDNDGFLNFSDSDLTTYGGTTTYFVEQMITDGGQDVTINPIQGSFYFTKPLREFQLVEAEYFQAVSGSGELKLELSESGDLVPIRVIEFLPLFVRLETATATTSPEAIRWSFNPTGRTVRQDIEPQVFIGSTQANVGSSPIAEYFFEDNLIVFREPVSSSATVQITYAVLESFGGEASYTVSTPPVYRPPFRIPAGQTSFDLEGDRTSEFEAGTFFRVGQFPFYITGSSFSNNITTVTFTPETSEEAGSRDPSANAVSLLSNFPLSTTLSTTAPDGFWRDVTTPYEPINRGFTEIVFLADISEDVDVGYLLELGGLPFVIGGVSVQNSRTTITITSFFPRGFNSSQDPAKISVRPVYQPFPSVFLGRGPFLSTEDFELILFGETDENGNALPGRTLRPTVDYVFDAGSGQIQFVNPPQEPLRPSQSLYFRRTDLDVLSPRLTPNFVAARFVAAFTYVQAPSEENNRLRKILRGTYTFSNPDTFYYRTVPLLDYLSDVAEEVARDVASRLPTQGPTSTLAQPTGNQDQGNFGLLGEIEDLQDQDRAARTFLEFYNLTIQAFEQVLESINGLFVGDRDGKFKFFVGKDKEYPPPGFEDAITGDLNPRNIFAELWFGYNRNLIFLFRDALVDPQTAELDNDQIVGDYIDSDLLESLQRRQRDLVQNDVDDFVLVGRGRKRLQLNPLRLEAFGQYRRLGEPSIYSRVFPERSEAFTLTDPGIGADLEASPPDPGVYSFSKRVARVSLNGEKEEKERASTFNTAIADIGNPVLGQITNIASIDTRVRLPRARIFAYSPTGFPEFDSQLAFLGITTFTSQPRPAVIATVIPLKDFPINNEGLPDITQLIANGGDIPDLTTGDPDLFTPAFQTIDTGENFYPRVAFGHPDGRIDDVSTSEVFVTSFLGEDYINLKPVFVGEILLGCIITFQDQDENTITDPNEIRVVSIEEGQTEGPVSLTRGDSVFVTSPNFDISPSDPPTNEEEDAFKKGLTYFRNNFDIRTDKSSGQYKDITFPQFPDPNLPIKELLGQRPPEPFQTLEAIVSFTNSRVEPLEIPALLGQNLNDSGDYTLPYVYGSNTELDRLGEVQKQFNVFFGADTPVPSAVYPDEIIGVDGQVLATLVGTTPPSTLLTDQDVTPVTTLGGYPPNSGIGDVGGYDLLLVETGQSIPAASQGILSVGSAEGGTQSQIKPPRFVTPTVKGDRFRYRFNAIMAFVNQPPVANPPGLIVSQVGLNTFFDITSISTALLVFNNGSALPNGGLNNIFDPGGIFTYPNHDNIIRINLWTLSGTFIQTVEFRGNGGIPTVTGDLGAQNLNLLPTATDNIITYNTPAPFVTITLVPGPGQIPEDPLNPGSSLPLWFTVDVDTSSNNNAVAPAASLSGNINQDRLSFEEEIDLRSVLPRDEPDVGGINVFGRLEVFFVTGGSSDAVTVNAPAEVNGGQPFTFLEVRPNFPRIGLFAGGQGQIMVQAFEGHSNTSISFSDVVFSAVPSSDQYENGIICQGTGDTSKTNDHRITVPIISGGAIQNIESGDICVIQGSDDPVPKAATVVGTYIVKHGIQPNVLTNDYRELELISKTIPWNSGVGFAQIQFPTTVSIDIAGSAQVFTTSLSTADGTSAWPLSGFLYFVVDPLDVTSTIRIQYVAVDLTQNLFLVQQGTGQDALGAFVPDSTFDNLPAGTLLTGFTNIDVRMDLAGADLPINTVGFDSAVTTAEGFFELTVENTGGNVTFNFGGAPAIVIGPPAVGEIGITQATPIPNGTFVNDPDAIVYQDVPGELQLNLSGAQWAVLHPGTNVEALFPGDSLRTTSNGFYAQAGVFFEPTTPTPVQDLNGPNELVVDANNTLPPGQLGLRVNIAYGESDPEPITFEVRRIRRWHEGLSTFGELLQPLRFAYEIRRGTVTSFGSQNVGPANLPWPYVIQADDGTNLGPFDDEDVNINPGDTFRLFDANGNLLEEAEIAAIQSGTLLLLKAPGLQTPSPDGLPFEIYLKKPTVPHEQSYEQLLDLITDEVLIDRSADLFTQQGGFVEVEQTPTEPRRLQDTDGTIDFINLGVQPGDILIIDAAGELTGPNGIPSTGTEFGTRPFGDRSVPGRTTAQGSQEVPFQAGGPSELDDNRGFYRITEVNSDSITVDSTTDFSLPLGEGFVTFGSGDTEYTVLPTISGSEAPFADPPGGPGVEGQMDLRPTAFAGTNGSPLNSFKENLYSIAPISYKIIRPSALFSQEAVDLVLLMRERTLSFIDEFTIFFNGTKEGDYFIFQRDVHISDLGNPLIPDEGLGVISNELITGAVGEINISPFANTSDAISVLDRRVWALDTRLDREFPPNQVGVPSYTALEDATNIPTATAGDTRPVLPDLIEDILDNNDRFRQLRLAWLDFRVNRETGLFTDITRNLIELPKRQAERIQQLLVDQSVESVT